LLDPATRQDWNGDVRRFADLIPSGYPIFENDRALAARQFRPSDEFVRAIMEEGPGLDGRLPPNRVPGRQRGQTETEPQYLARIRHEVGSARRILEERLQKRIEFICFPGGAYNAEVLRATDDAGYVGFMRSSRERRGDNRTSLTNALARREVPGKAVGFTRVSVTKELPAGWIRSDLLHYWNARLKVGAFAWPDRYGPALRIVRAGGRAMRSLGWSRAYSGTRLE
ncbi:MAG TPA: hypothetical protein VK936_16105, partial [Longimicrobiales bacterium]|nr:hypothetical protein [Longimicrobiales bacterium]